MLLVRQAMKQKQQKIMHTRVSKAMFWIAVIFVVWRMAHWEPTATGYLDQHGLGGMAVLETATSMAKVGGRVAGK
jgi:hypothetical protein